MITSYPCTQSHLLSSKRKSVTKRTKSSVIRFDKGRPILFGIMNEGKEKGDLDVIPYLLDEIIAVFLRNLCPEYHPTLVSSRFPPIAAQPYNSCRNVILSFTQSTNSVNLLNIQNQTSHAPNYIKAFGCRFWS